MRPNKAIVSGVALGGAIGVLVTWVISFGVDVPGEIGAAIGTVATFVVQRFPGIFGS
jgi:hypothetical protein